MRTIKFRAWDKEGNDYSDWKPQMIYPDKWAEAAETKGGVLYPHESNRYDFMQYTGLKDKNKKDAYHKDLITNPSRNGGKAHPIEWSERFGAWVGKYGSLEYLIAEEIEIIEIIGNIYEPELIKS